MKTNHRSSRNVSALDVDALDAVCGGLGLFRLASTAILPTAPTSLPAASIIGAPATVPATQLLAPTMAPLQEFSDAVVLSVNQRYGGGVADRAVQTSVGARSLGSIADELARGTGGAVDYIGDRNGNRLVDVDDFLTREGDAGVGRVVSIIDRLHGLGQQELARTAAPAFNPQSMLNSLNSLLPQLLRGQQGGTAPRAAGGTAANPFSALRAPATGSATSPSPGGGGAAATPDSAPTASDDVRSASGFAFQPSGTTAPSILGGEDGTVTDVNGVRYNMDGTVLSGAPSTVTAATADVAPAGTAAFFPAGTQNLWYVPDGGSNQTILSDANGGLTTGNVTAATASVAPTDTTAFYNGDLGQQDLSAYVTESAVAVNTGDSFDSSNFG